jgi:outer membrane protein
MNRSVVIVAILASGLLLNAAQRSAAQAPRAPATAPGPAASATPQTAKIAVIAFQVAVAQTNEGQREFADLEKKFDPRRQQLKQQSDEIDTLTKQLQSQSATLSDDERASKTQEINEKKRQLDRNTQDAQSDFQEAVQDLYQKLGSKVYDVLESLAQKRGYTLVLDISQQQNPVLYASAATNITKDVIDAYNVKSGVTAPPAQSSTTIPEAPKPVPEAPTPASH